MKRFAALLLALVMALGTASAQEAEMTAQGVTVVRNHVEETVGHQQIVVDYPTFSCEDPQLELYLTDQITAPIQALQRRGQMAQDDAYADGGLDEIRGGYNVSLDFPGLLSVEATVRNRPVDAQEATTEFFYLLVDLDKQQSVTVNDLFEEDAGTVNAALQSAVYARVSAQEGLAPIASKADVPMPKSYFVASAAFRLLYAPGQLADEAVVVDIPWSELALTPSSLMTGEETQPAATATPQVQQTATPLATVTPAPPATLDPNFSLAPVVTPTPMPLAGNDAITVDVLTHGLWKPLGTDGEVYYQFTADGKLLTVTVTDYTVTDGVLASGVLNGTLDIGSDSAFTLHGENGELSGYVLNRQGESVAPEEFVTPTPTPIPTPTPSPTPPPTPTPTPTPTPSPTPTLSPYQQAVQQAPNLANLSDAAFEKAQTLPVYCAPGEETYRVDGAQVDTDEPVLIYGVENGWVLVSYTIGNGSRGRIGYIKNTTLADAENVAKLGFCSVPLTLASDCEGTDDPLYGKEPLTSLQAGDKVTLLAFMGDEWAYVQIGLEGRVCRLFIPRSALSQN